METPTGPHLLLFLSFSAPSDTWKSFSADLQALGGTIVLRGLPNNSFQEFALRIKHLKEEGVDVPIQIDPDAFERYNIEAVPTLVLAHKEISDQLTGNLTISSTLQRFKESGSLQHEASLLLSKLKHPYEKTNE